MAAPDIWEDNKRATGSSNSETERIAVTIECIDYNGVIVTTSISGKRALATLNAAVRVLNEIRLRPESR